MTSPDTTPVALVREIELDRGIPAISAPRAGVQLLALVRVFTEPLGTLTIEIPEHGVGPAELATRIATSLGPQIRSRLLQCGLPWDETLPTNGLTPPTSPAFLASRAAVLRAAPSMTAVVCTHDRPEWLAIALEALCQQEYRGLRILVIDNAPSDQRSREVVASFAERHDVAYAVEPRPGLSWARNRALELTETELIAWADDDDVCDKWWAAEIARGFVEVPEADAVTGTMIPTELDTPSQLFFEQYGGLRRQRGFERAVFSPTTRHLQSPLYPLPPFGIGANMAFRRTALERIGGFDCALGAGTMTRTAEDTAALSSVLLAGGTIVYQPTALVRHRHRPDGVVLREHLLGHGRGLGAFYTSMLIKHPGSLVELLRLTPQALRDQFSSRGRRLSKLDDAFPSELLRANRVGLLQGPFVYAGARLHARRLRKMAPVVASTSGGTAG